MQNVGLTLRLDTGHELWVLTIVIVDLIPSDFVICVDIRGIIGTNLLHARAWSLL